MESAFKALGLGMPFGIAGATVALFTWLDKHASTDANSAKAEWLRGESYKTLDFSRGILAAFDRLYTRPLFSRRALFRSGSISVFAYLIFSSHYIYNGASDKHVRYNVVLSALVAPLLVTIVADYISLFVVRKRLSYAGARPILSFVIAIAAAVMIIAFIYALIFAAALLLVGENGWFNVFWDFEHIGASFFVFLLDEHVFTSTMLIHLWLFLFIIGSIGFRSVALGIKAITWMQWFLRGGQKHPLRAIGLVAGSIVFTVGAIVEGAIRLA
jgi:hypothetical protein